MTIYLDNNATTRPDPEVVTAMVRCLEEHWGNPSSAHSQGRMPEALLVQARERLASLLNTSPQELVFSSGATESITQVFKGVFETFPTKRHFILSSIEHSAVQAQATWLKRQGADVSLLPVDGDGRVSLEALSKALRPDTALVSVMTANNETGVIQPVSECAAMAKAAGAFMHTDAVQAAGKLPLDLPSLGVDLATFSAHKFHGPKGVGALFIRRGLRLRPLLLGGHQERDRRGGTENLAGIVGMGVAAKLAKARLPELERVRVLRDRMESQLREALPEVRIHGASAERLPNTCLLSLPDLEGEALLLKLDEVGICVSTGSACTTGQKEPSHVLWAMGVPLELARGTLRLSLSHETSEAEIEQVVRELPRQVSILRGLGPMAR